LQLKHLEHLTAVHPSVRPAKPDSELKNHLSSDREYIIAFGVKQLALQSSINWCHLVL